MPALRHFSQNVMWGNQLGGVADPAAVSLGSHAELIATETSEVADSLVVSVMPGFIFLACALRFAA